MLSTQYGAPPPLRGLQYDPDSIAVYSCCYVDNAQDPPLTSALSSYMCLLPVMQDVWPLPIAGVGRAQHDII